MTVHDFTAKKREAEAISAAAFFDAKYLSEFGANVGIKRHPKDGEHQRAGIDVTLTLDDAHVLRLDEKLRSGDFADILLEYEHTDGHPAWITKPLLCDYIAYGVPKLDVVYLLPVVQLQAAWRRCGAKWLGEHKRIEAENRGYVTRSVCVPVRSLFGEMGQQLRLRGGR